MKRRPKSREDAENMISLPLKFDEVESVEEFVNNGETPGLRR